MGVACDQQQEDRYRLQIDEAIKRVHPPLFPTNYRVDFVQIRDDYDQILGEGRSWTDWVGCSSVVRVFAHGVMGRQIDPSWGGPIESYFSFQPVLHDRCNKGRGMCYPVCGMVHIKEPFLLIGKSRPCGGSGFPFSLSEWSFTICSMLYNRKIKCARNEICYSHMGYSFWLLQGFFFYIHHCTDRIAYHGVCYTSGGALAVMRAMGWSQSLVV